MTEQELLPIDVNYQKLAEWLIQRQKLPKDWHKMVHAIQAKMAEAVKQLPAGFLSKLESGQDVPLDYFAAVEISRALDSQEGSRNMLGVRTGNAAVWEKVVKAYEKNLLFVGEACQTMIQNADHEIPYLRKQAARCDQLVSDGEKKQAELLKAAAACAAAYKEECAKLGIEGVQVRAELEQLVSKLPGMFLEVVEKLRDSAVGQAVNYYQQFAAAVHDLPEESKDTTLPVLKQVTAAKESDRAAVLQQGSIKQSTSSDAPQATKSDSKPAPSGIDWDLDLSALADTSQGAQAPAPSNIDWDVSLDAAASAEPGPAGIDWDVAVDPAAADGAAAAVDIDWDVSAAAVGDSAGAGVDINWDVDVAASGEEAGTAAGIDWEVVTGESGDAGAGATINWDIDLAEEGAGEAVEIDWDLGNVSPSGEGAAPEAPSEARSEAEGKADRDATSVAGTGEPSTTADVVQQLQHDSDFRAKLLDDIQELKAFLVTRRSELQASGTDIFLALLPEALQLVDKERISSMSCALEAAEQALLSDKLRQLLLIMTSPQYLDRLVRTLQLKAGQEARLNSSRKEVEAKRNESILNLKELQPKILKLVSRTKMVKAAVEKALASQFAGRRINVLGEINVVLAHAG